MKPTFRIALALVLCGTFSITWARNDADTLSAPAPPPQPIAFVGATIRTQTEAGDMVGTLVVKDGKILAMGPSASVPAGALRVEAAKFVITPGLIDCRSVLWLNSGTARETGTSASLNILDGVDSFADDWRDAARQGVTAVYVQPNGSLGGSGAMLRVGPAALASELTIRSPAGVQATLGLAAPAPAAANPQLNELFARFGITPPAQPAPTTPPSANSLTRYAQYETFRGQFDAAKRYGENKPATKDAGKELLLLALKRDIPLRLETAHEDDVRNVLKMTSDFGLRTIFDRLDRVKTLPEELAARKDPIIVSGTISGGVRKLALDGRKFALGTYADDPRGTAWLRAQAAALVADGYPRDRVLQALTRDAAELHGVSDKLGGLAVGRVADLVVFAGDPLDASAPVRMTISQGIVTYDNPKVEVAPAVIAAKPTVPDHMPASYVLKTSRLLNESGEFAPGELFIENGKVADKAALPSSAPTVDVGDAPVTPGFVVANVNYGNENFPDADAGHLRAIDGVTHDDAKLRSYRDAGFMTAVVAPGSANVIAGMSSVVKCADTSAAANAGLKFVLSAPARHNDRYPASMIGQIELIRDRLSGAPAKSDIYMPAFMTKALFAQRDQAINEVRNRKLTAYFDVQTRAEVRAALRLIADHKLNGVLVQPKQLDDLADEIRAANVGVVIGPVQAQDGERICNALVALGKAGVPMALGGGNASELRSTTAWLVNAGLPRNVAGRTFVAQSSERFGLPAGTSRLSAGDAADFVVWDGDPIDIAAKPQAVVVAGQRVARGS